MKDDRVAVAPVGQGTNQRQGGRTLEWVLKKFSLTTSLMFGILYLYSKYLYAIFRLRFLENINSDYLFLYFPNFSF